MSAMENTLAAAPGNEEQLQELHQMCIRDRLKEVAEKRLHAIREFTDLGSGFKICLLYTSRCV